MVQVGERVILTHEYDGLPKGSKGKVVSISQATASIELEEYFRLAHSCGGRVSNGNGWYVQTHLLSTIEPKQEEEKIEGKELVREAIEALKRERGGFQEIEGYIQQLEQVYKGLEKMAPKEKSNIKKKKEKEYRRNLEKAKKS